MPAFTTTDCDNRQRLIEAAAEAFRAEGYRASIDTIAARAGVARQTLYNHFPNKDALFREVGERAARDILVALEGDGGDLRARLLRFALALRASLIGDAGLAMFRTLAAEAPRFPALARGFFEQGPRQAVERLARVLADEMAAGHVRQDDPLFAAEMLLSMLTGFDRTRRLFGAPPLAPRAERARTARIVDCFLRAYPPERITT
jgi:AcrR family transcriptional regulator